MASRFPRQYTFSFYLNSVTFPVALFTMGPLLVSIEEKEGSSSSFFLSASLYGLCSTLVFLEE